MLELLVWMSGVVIGTAIGCWLLMLGIHYWLGVEMSEIMLALPFWKSDGGKP